jgi:hypothetical protein
MNPDPFCMTDVTNDQAEMSWITDFFKTESAVQSTEITETPLTGGPGQFPTTEEMKVNVKDSLSPVLSSICHQPVSRLRNPFLSGHIASGKQQLTQ